MSFVDLMGYDIWTEADILKRTESIVRSQFSLDEETILNRKFQGATLGQYVLTEADLNEMHRFKEIVSYSQQEGISARADMVLLTKVLQIEPSFLRLRLPLVEFQYDDEGNILNQEAIDLDMQEREAAQQIVDSASTEVLDLCNFRNPVSEDSDSEEGMATNLHEPVQI